MKLTTNENIVIKEKLPKIGIVSSNPARTKRIVQNCLGNIKLHSNSWGIAVYTGNYKNKKEEIFVASVPMGAGGSGFAFLEMYVAGAEYIVRYGSDDRYSNYQNAENNLKDIIIVDSAYGLCDLMKASGVSKAELGKHLKASPLLTEAFIATAKRLNYTVKQRSCYHVEDYHALNYPELMGIKNNVRVNLPNNVVCDMETAALFWRAEQFKRHAITILQCLAKNNNPICPYNGEYGKIAIEMEKEFCNLILEAIAKQREY